MPIAGSKRMSDDLCGVFNLTRCPAVVSTTANDRNAFQRGQNDEKSADYFYPHYVLGFLPRHISGECGGAQNVRRQKLRFGAN
jgi:hypothetical protein